MVFFLFIFCVCVRAHMRAHVHSYLYWFVHVEARVDVCYFLRQFTFILSVFLIEPEAHQLTRLADQQARDPPVSGSQH